MKYGDQMTSEDTLAVIHIGMMLSEYTVNESLPESLEEVGKELNTIFGIKVNEENSIIHIRNKMVAVIESMENTTWN